MWLSCTCLYRNFICLVSIMNWIFIFLFPTSEISWKQGKTQVANLSTCRVWGKCATAFTSSTSLSERSKLGKPQQRWSQKLKTWGTRINSAFRLFAGLFWRDFSRFSVLSGVKYLFNDKNNGKILSFFFFYILSV